MVSANLADLPDNIKISEPIDRVGIIVLGMHRSGTSALSRVLSFLGCELPKTLMAGNFSNLPGHWESAAICRLNDRILWAVDSTWRDWMELDPHSQYSPKFDEFRQEALATFRDEFGSSGLFVLKDPRICRLVPFWANVFQDAGVRPLIVLPLRNPLEVASSLEKRDGFDFSYSNLLWLRHVLDSEYATRGMPRVFTSFDGLLANWRGFVDQSQAAFGISWPQLTERTAAEIEAFLSEKHRHHRKDESSVVDNPMLPEWLRETYRILSGWANGGEVTNEFAALDQIRGAFNAAAPAFAQLVEQGQEATRTTCRLQGELIAAQAAWTEAEQMSETRLRQAAAEAEARLAEVEQMSETCLRQAESEAEAKLAEVEQVFESRLHKAAAEAKVRFDEASQTIETLRREVEAESVSRQEREHQLNERVAEIAGLTRTLHDLEREARTNALHTERLRRIAVDELGRFVTALFDSCNWRLAPGRLRRKWQAEVLMRSGLFDGEWYLRRNGDVIDAGDDPIRHFVEHGFKEGRAPNAIFAEIIELFENNRKIR